MSECESYMFYSLSTLDREYRALLTLQYSEMSDFIMQPRLKEISGVDRKDLAETMHKYRVNEPQATAILKALKTNGFSLIQGYAFIVNPNMPRINFLQASWNWKNIDDMRPYLPLYRSKTSPCRHNHTRPKEKCSNRRYGPCCTRFSLCT